MEENEGYVPCDSPMDAQSFVRNRLIDADEEDDVRIHLSTLCGDHVTLGRLLKEEGHGEWLNFRVRPFSATPLRLAATVGSVCCLSLLLDAGANIDLEDIKGQTPLFVATSSRDLDIMEILLKRGANPEGSFLNRGTPLLVAVRDGFTEGVKLLLRYGANPEPFDQLTTCVPGWPLHHSIVYSHFSCFLALLQGGAIPNLSSRYTAIPPLIMKRLSIPHAMLKYAREKPEFVRLYYDCGGDIANIDPTDPLCQNSSDVKREIFKLQKIPRSLKSLSRVHVLKRLRRNSDLVSRLEIPSCLHSFLRFEEYNGYAIKTKQNIHIKEISNEE